MLEEKLTAGIIIESTNQGTSQEGLIEKITSYIYSYNLDVLLGPEWLFMPEKRLYTKKEKEEIIRRVAESTKDRDTLIIPGSIMWEDNDFFYNTAPIISKGQLIGENHKSLDGGDGCRANERNCKKILNNKKSEYLFKWKDYQIGVEICADMGCLYSYLEKNGQPFLDLYFLVSDGVLITKYENEIPARLNGYALNSDGEGLSIVLRRSKGRFDRLCPKPILDGIEIYELTWEKNA